jgi:SSS family solute:Na+ symporter
MMSLGAWGVAWLALYLSGLAYLSVRARRYPDSNKGIATNLSDFYKSTRNRLKPVVLVFTFAATLFSAFFMVGLPGFIYTHGLGTWAWVIFGDVVGMLVLYFVGKRFVLLVSENKDALSPLQIICPDSLSRFLFIAVTAVFVIPYLAVQISGFGKLIESSTGGDVSMFAASAVGLVIMIIYSIVAGVRGIAFSDLLQGVILLGCVTILGVVVTSEAGGPFELLRNVQEQKPELLTAPGPSGLMTTGFLLTGFAIFVALPATQPQFLTRYLLIDTSDTEEALRYFKRVAIGMGGLIAIGTLFIVPITMSGVINNPDLTSGDKLLGSVLKDHQALAWLGGLFTVGVLAAAMSTADSILFSLGQIFSVDIYKKIIAPEATDEHMKRVSHIFIIGVALVGLLVGVANSELIVFLARLTFEGTLLLLPAVVAGLWMKNSWRHATTTSIILGVMTYWILIEQGVSMLPGLSSAIPATVVAAIPFFFKSDAKINA